ncbi:MAG: hypothetical protein NC417_11900 [Candidatus Gastranaerophilales bacterium]|nr:hypothetical protein [Candidatus Gastranaerophilales bacterium]
MRQLEILLQNISPAEREEALQYYNDYFNDAGAENEQSVIAALGTPARVAENIKRDLNGANHTGENAGDFEAVRPSGNAQIIRYQGEFSGQGQSKVQESEKTSTGMIILIVFLCILASPVLFGVGSGVLGTAVGVIVGWFALIFGFGVTALALLVVMLVLMLLGIIVLFYAPLVGLSLLGAGLLCGGVGILFLMLTVAMAGIATPAICRGIAGLWRTITGKKQPA